MIIIKKYILSLVITLFLMTSGLVLVDINFNSMKTKSNIQTFAQLEKTSNYTYILKILDKNIFIDIELVKEKLINIFQQYSNEIIKYLQ